MSLSTKLSTLRFFFKPRKFVAQFIRELKYSSLMLIDPKC